MAMHTPGPWEVETLDGYITGHVISPNKNWAGNSAPQTRRDSITGVDSMTAADARLIAAAPCTLAALEALVLAYEELDAKPGVFPSPWAEQAHSKAKAAIAAARGEDVDPHKQAR